MSSRRHRLDNKYTAPKKGSLLEKIQMAEQSIVNEANSQRYRGIGICATGVSASKDEKVSHQREAQLAHMTSEQKKTVLAQQRYVEKNFSAGGTASKAEAIAKKIEEENVDKSCAKRQSVQFAGHLGRVKGDFAKVAKNPDEERRVEDRVETSSQRSQNAADKIKFEMYEICETIQTLGLPDDDGGYMVEFGELFETYNAVSSQTVGLLIRARRRGYVYFEGETLLKGKDDNEIVTLIEMPPKPWEEG